MTVMNNASDATLRHVPESAFGVWFLATETWTSHVVRRALDDLERLLEHRVPRHAAILDVGCGWGQALVLLHQRHAPKRLIGIDIEPRVLAGARAVTQREGITAELRQESCAAMGLADESMDIVLCHQTFHHLVDQEGCLSEMRRVLKPGGLLLFAESTRAYITSWIIRLLFRHPMEVQRSATEYLAMIRAAGFEIGPDAVSYPYLWWSRPDLGIAEHWFGRPPAVDREETLLNVVARRI